MEPFSKSPYEGEDSLKIVSEHPYGLDDPERLGSYSKTKKALYINPAQSDEEKVESLSHEISHFRLGHKDTESITEEDLSIRLKGIKERVPKSLDFLESLTQEESKEDRIDLERLISEFEVRIYQKEKGYSQSTDESFKSYLVDILKETKDLESRSLSVGIALQAITNMERLGNLSRSRSKFYRKTAYSIGRDFGIRGFS